MKKDGADLNAASAVRVVSLRSTQGHTDEFGQHSFHPTHGPFAMDHLRPDSAPLQREPQRADAELRGAFQGNGLCPTHLSESLRDIETCMAAQPAKLYGMGFRTAVRRTTLADAN